jgi:protein-S-isoprenylcysteine O-methyltransferase Ste14
MNRQQIILLISFIWMASEIILGFVKHSKGNAAKGLDRISLRILWVTIVASIAIAIFIAFSGIGHIASGSAMISIVGLVLLIVGIIIRGAAIMTLRRYFTVDVTIVKDHKIIERGLYRYVRHPSYAGSILSFLGLGLTYSNWLSTIVIVLPVLAAYLYRIKVEEAALINAFGDSYRDYSRRTKRLIPWIY